MSKKILKTVKQKLNKKITILRNNATLRLPKREVVYLSVAVLALISATVMPLLHHSYIRRSVGSKVFMVRSSPKGGGGTGFVVKAPSGNNYLMTNDHVCAASKDGQTMVVMNDDGEWIPRRILHKSDTTDLCLLESMPGIDGLELSESPSIGQTLTAVGHPGLMPLALSHGEMLGSKDISILLFITLDKEDPNCKKPKNSLIEIGYRTVFSPTDISISPIYACLINIKSASLTSAMIMPGSSGSPVVNWRGQLQGVMFAGGPYGWGIAVSSEDIRDMLKLY